VDPPSFLADVERLNQQAAVCLTDVPRLADDELGALEDYVRGGGGVAFFVGAETDRSYYNARLFANGKGLFPVPLKLPNQLMDADESAADVEVTQHPIFHVFAGRRNDFLPLVMIDYYYALPDDWTPPRDGSIEVIGRLRNQAPLVVEKKYGDGRVVAQLTKLSSGETPLGKWSNWSLNPAFPVLANELVSYLAATREIDPVHRVGEDLVVSLEEGKYEPTVRFVLPSDGSRNGGPGTRAEVPVDAKPDKGRLVAKLEDVGASGVYEARLQPLQGDLQTRDFAVNVAAGEGDLRIEPGAELTRQLAGVDFQMHDAADMALDSQQVAGFQMSDALLAALIVLLLAEQIFAYLASYHVPPLRGATR
jgi:hypothetical protein